MIPDLLKIYVKKINCLETECHWVHNNKSYLFQIFYSDECYDITDYVIFMNLPISYLRKTDICPVFYIKEISVTKRKECLFSFVIFFNFIILTYFNIARVDLQN